MCLFLRSIPIDYFSTMWIDSNFKMSCSLGCSVYFFIGLLYFQHKIFWRALLGKVEKERRVCMNRVSNTVLPEEEGLIHHSSWEGGGGQNELKTQAARCNAFSVWPNAVCLHSLPTCENPLLIREQQWLSTDTLVTINSGELTVECPEFSQGGSFPS